MDDHKKLIEELRARGNARHSGEMSPTAVLCDQAATALEGLVGERDEVLTFVLNARADQEAAEARATAAEASLKELRGDLAETTRLFRALRNATTPPITDEDREWAASIVSQIEASHPLSPPDTAETVSSRSLG